MSITRVACVGAGNIADIHASVLQSLPGVALSVVVEPAAERARIFAEKWGIGKTYASVDDLISAGAADVAHVLVPPFLHKKVAERLLAAGIHVLLEKPMAQSGAECAALQKAAAHGNSLLRVNHNAVFQPAHRTLRHLIAANRIGPIRHVVYRFNLPLRQLGARQLGHWMFDSPLNLLLEQAVHPLSQIDDLVGSARAVVAVTSPPLHLGEGQDIVRSWLISLDCERGGAQLLVSLGESYPSWGATVVGDDGVIHVDYLNNRVAYEVNGPRMEPINGFASGVRMAATWHWQALANLTRSSASIARIRPRSDAFYLSMKESIAQFYHDLQTRSGDFRGIFGRRMVELCERVADAAGTDQAPLPPSLTRTQAIPDVLVIGGTGFIGTHVVARLLAEGRSVGVLARNIANLPQLFTNPRVQVVRGDARKSEDIAAAIGSTPVVINLAHGGGGASRAEIEASVVGSARTVGEACLAHSVRRLIFVSSIAALYLGDPAETVTGLTPPDPLAEDRADYARAKAQAEQALLELRRARGLPVTILRPGVVIGAGGTLFHSGVGFFNQETHCLGWNRGLNPLPLVLAEEVADAIARAIEAPTIDGKCYNIVGDIRLSAADYIAELARATGRPLLYHPQSVLKLYLIEIAKTLIKRASGRREAWPSLRDLKSRGLAARFDCSDAMHDLDWQPVRDREQFLRQGFPVHGG
jgi:predicted dehydrogenase/nucleoside-diphosphate-sugar epimerase